MHIEVGGTADVLEAFLGQLTRQSPPLAQIEELSWKPLEVRGERTLRIEPSERDAAADLVVIAPLGAVRQMLVRHFNTPPTSSTGQLFDAISAPAGDGRVGAP